MEGNASESQEHFSWIADRQDELTRLNNDKYELEQEGLNNATSARQISSKWYALLGLAVAITEEAMSRLWECSNKLEQTQADLGARTNMLVRTMGRVENLERRLKTSSVGSSGGSGKEQLTLSPSGSVNSLENTSSGGENSPTLQPRLPQTARASENPRFVRRVVPTSASSVPSPSDAASDALNPTLLPRDVSTADSFCTSSSGSDENYFEVMIENETLKTRNASLLREREALERKLKMMETNAKQLEEKYKGVMEMIEKQENESAEALVELDNQNRLLEKKNTILAARLKDLEDFVLEQDNSPKPTSQRTASRSPLPNDSRESSSPPPPPSATTTAATTGQKATAATIKPGYRENQQQGSSGLSARQSMVKRASSSVTFAPTDEPPEKLPSREKDKTSSTAAKKKGKESDETNEPEAATPRYGRRASVFQATNDPPSAAAEESKSVKSTTTTTATNSRAEKGNNSDSSPPPPNDTQLKSARTASRLSPSGPIVPGQRKPSPSPSGPLSRSATDVLPLKSSSWGGGLAPPTAQSAQPTISPSRLRPEPSKSPRDDTSTTSAPSNSSTKNTPFQSKRAIANFKVLIKKVQMQNTQAKLRDSKCTEAQSLSLQRRVFHFEQSLAKWESKRAVILATSAMYNQPAAPAIPRLNTQMLRSTDGESLRRTPTLTSARSLNVPSLQISFGPSSSSSGGGGGGGAAPGAPGGFAPGWRPRVASDANGRSQENVFKSKTFSGLIFD